VKYWLVKSEPSSYSWQQMQIDKVMHWDGVRNYQARNNLRAMQLGDLAFFYHSSRPVSKLAYVDELRGDLGAQNPSILNIHEDSTTKSTTQVASEAEFRNVSHKEREIKGLVRVVREHYRDHTDDSGRFDMVDFEYVESLKRPVSLQEIKSHPLLQNIALIKQSRLSVMPITENECHIIMTLSKNFR
jgi:predicted RNA-binding protein with PUA-like domain